MSRSLEGSQQEGRGDLAGAPPGARTAGPAAAAGRSATFYRIVAGRAPTADDFRSNRDKGLPPRGPELADPSLWTGFSVFDRREAAATRARRYGLGTHVAALRLPQEWVDDPRRVRKTLGARHFTVWATFPELEPFITDVTPVGA